MAISNRVSSIIGPALTELPLIYPDVWTKQTASVIAAIAFAGTVVGQLGMCKIKKDIWELLTRKALGIFRIIGAENGVYSPQPSS